jgi:hypothetical protein
MLWTFMDVDVTRGQDPRYQTIGPIQYRTTMTPKWTYETRQESDIEQTVDSSPAAPTSKCARTRISSSHRPSVVLGRR